MINHDEEEVIEIFESNDKAKICDVMLSLAFYEEDWIWVQNQCLKLLNHKDIDIKGLAVVCLGHIARIQGKLELTAIEKLKHLKKDPLIGNRVEDALDDIDMYIFNKKH